MTQLSKLIAQQKNAAISKQISAQGFITLADGSSESFKQIEGRPELWVSDQGRVFDSKLCRFRKLSSITNGYLQVSIGDRKLLVHRLVALAFIPNPEHLDTVNHKNEVRSDNRLINLEWMSTGDNIRYSQSKHVAFLDPDGNIVHVQGIRPFARKHGLDQGNMNAVSLGKANHHKGWTAFHFDYGVTYEQMGEAA